MIVSTSETSGASVTSGASGCRTYRGGSDDLLGDHPQGVHYRDVAEPASDPQRRVAVLQTERGELPSCYVLVKLALQRLTWALPS